MLIGWSLRANGVADVANMTKIAEWSSRTSISTRSIGQSRRCVIALAPNITSAPAANPDMAIEALAPSAAITAQIPIGIQADAAQR